MKIKVGGELVNIGDLNAAFLGAGWGRGWPGPSNSGYLAAPDFPGDTPDDLIVHDGSPILSNSTYRFIDFGGVDLGSQSIPVHGVTLHSCRVKDVSVAGALMKLYADGEVNLSFVSFEPGSIFVPGVPSPHDESYQYGISCSGAFNTFHDVLNIESCDFWGFGNAIDLGNPGSSTAHPVSIRHTWIHDAANDGFEDPDVPPGEVYHTDGIGHLTGLGGESHLLIEHNTIESPGNTNGIALQAGFYDHVKINQNLLGGFGFTVMIWGTGDPTPSDISFTNNVLTTRLKPNFGPLYSNQPEWGLDGNFWQWNKLWVPDGASWGDPADNGKYWVPNAIDLSDHNYDTSLITSDTDFVP